MKGLAEIYFVKSASEKMTLDDEMGGKQAVRYLTATDRNAGSENLYYFSLTGEDAEIEWQEGDSLMLELRFCAYKTNGQWHMSHCLGSIKLIEICKRN